MRPFFSKSLAVVSLFSAVIATGCAEKKSGTGFDPLVRQDAGRDAGPAFTGDAGPSVDPDQRDTGPVLVADGGPLETDAGPIVEADAGEPEVDAGSRIPPELIEQFRTDYCGPLVGAFCAGAVACSCGADVDVTGCESRMLDVCISNIEWPISMVASGAWDVDWSLASTCFADAEIAAADCRTPTGGWIFEPCQKLFFATADFGAYCEASYCASGDGLCGESVCTALPALGEMCDGRCAGDLRCIEGTCQTPHTAGGDCKGEYDCEYPLSCVDRTCQAVADVGGACTENSDCRMGLRCGATGMCEAGFAACESWTECSGEASCEGRYYNVCDAQVAHGEPCEQDSACPPEDFCADPARTCATRPAIGAACGNGWICGADATCNFETGLCDAIPSAGEACTPWRDDSCAEDLGCTAGICGALPGGGEACTDDQLCAEGFGCQWLPDGTSVCVVRRGVGDTCSSDAVCETGTYCNWDSGTCQAVVGIGEACPFSTMCGTDLVCLWDDSVGMGTCVTTPTLGESCSWDGPGQCDDGLYCRGRIADGTCIPPLCSAVRWERRIID